MTVAQCCDMKHPSSKRKLVDEMYEAMYMLQSGIMEKLPDNDGGDAADWLQRYYSIMIQDMMKKMNTTDCRKLIAKIQKDTDNMDKKNWINDLD